MQTYKEQQWIEWFEQLSKNDYLIADNFISKELYGKIRAYFDRLLAEEEFSQAGIGTSQQHQIKTAVRGDLIYWLDRDRDESLSDFFSLADELVAKLKQYCFLSTSDYEFHLAHYPPGTRYEKHTDQFRGRTNRVISVLLYLNEQWTPADGGELKIFRKEDEILVEPIARRLVLFKSDTLEHEVLVTQAGRMSLTGWLLRQPSSLGSLMH